MTRIAPRTELRLFARQVANWCFALRGLVLHLFALLMLSLCGCDSRPSAPMLDDAPVYDNPQEGFRFLVPEGWAQTASSVLPAGSLSGESFLVRYRMRTPEQSATFQILCIDADAVTELAEHHGGPSFRVERWEQIDAAEAIDIQGKPATRLIHQGQINGRAMTKEVVCFENRGRLYSFIGMHWSNDDKAAQQLRRAVNSTLWYD